MTVKQVSCCALSPRVKSAFRDTRRKPPSETSHTEDELLEEVVDVSDVEVEVEEDADAEVEVVVELDVVEAGFEAVLCTKVLVTRLVTVTMLAWVPGDFNPTGSPGEQVFDKEEAIHKVVTGQRVVPPVRNSALAPYIHVLVQSATDGAYQETFFFLTHL